MNREQQTALHKLLSEILCNITPGYYESYLTGLSKIDRKKCLDLLELLKPVEEIPPAYRMTSERKMIQIDCRITDCRYNRSSGNCTNEAPAITLNQNKTVVCWAKGRKEG